MKPKQARIEAARILGKAKSFKKTMAVRLNGKKGGWKKGRKRKQLIESDDHDTIGGTI